MPQNIAEHTFQSETESVFKFFRRSADSTSVSNKAFPISKWINCKSESRGIELLKIISFCISHNVLKHPYFCEQFRTLLASYK